MKTERSLYFGVIGASLLPLALGLACGSESGPEGSSTSATAGQPTGIPSAGAGGSAGSSSPGAGSPGTGGTPPVAGAPGAGAPGAGGAPSVAGAAGVATAGQAGSGSAGVAGSMPDGGMPDGSMPDSGTEPDSGMPDGGMDDAGPDGGGLDPSWCVVGPVPEDLRQEWDVDPYYQKYANANGIPILTSSSPPDNTLVLACELVLEMVSLRDDVRLALIDNQVHFTVIGMDEQTNDVPEYSYLSDSINTRARGLGGNPGMCAEESILCDASDRWRGESICIHEFAHTISIYGLYDADPTFEDRLREAYENARDQGLWADTYAMENEQEYWGEGVQNWYYTNLTSNPPNGVHGPIDTREELLEYDPALYALIAEWLSEDVSWDDCYRHGG